MSYTVGWQDIEEGVDTGLSANAKIREGFINTQTAINSLDDRTGILEQAQSEFVSLVLSGNSSAESQQPEEGESSLFIEFGNAQNGSSDKAMLDGNGVVTFNQAGTYKISISLQYGRDTGATGTSVLAFRCYQNSSVIAKPRVVTLSNSDVANMTLDVLMVASIGDTFTLEMNRDDSGDDSGGLIQTVLTSSGWISSPTAYIQINKLV